MRRTLVALWFADIAGYSEHAAKDETSALRMVEILQTLSRKTVTRYNGRVVKFLGDAVLAEFPSAEPAAFSAAELSRQFEEQSARIGDRGQVRVGVHLGDVAVAADGDLYGDAVDAAARLQHAAAPGPDVVGQDSRRRLGSRPPGRPHELG